MKMTVNEPTGDLNLGADDTLQASTAPANADAEDATVAEPGEAPKQRHRVAAILILFSVVAIASYLALDVWLMTRRVVE